MLTRKKSAMEDFRVLPYSKIVAVSRYQNSRVQVVSYLSTSLETRVVQSSIRWYQSSIRWYQLKALSALVSMTGISPL